MSKKFKLIRPKPVRELEKSDAMMAIVETFARKVQNTAGSGFKVTSRKGKNRAIAKITPETTTARKLNAETNVLLKALYSAKSG